MMATEIHGIVPALVTPFHEHGGIDLDALDALVNFQIDAGVHALHPGGTTGEAPLLTIDERKKVTEQVVTSARGRIPVVAQVGHIRSEFAVELARHAVDAGATAVSVVAPYYYALPERALVAYFLEVATAVPEAVPVYLYNIPQCTGNPVTADVLLRVCDGASNVVGLKHSEPDIDRLSAYLRGNVETQVLVGSDGLVLAGLSVGAVGAVSGNANVVPELFVALYDAWRARQIERARRCQHAIADIAALLGNGADLARFKEALRLRGIPTGSVRAPLAQLDDAARAGATAAVEAFERHMASISAEVAGEA